MAPTVRRSWAPRGKTPILKRRGRSHTKVSAIGAVCARPGRRNRRTARVYFRLHAQKNINAEGCREFLRQLLANIKGPLIVVWDRLAAHRSGKIKSFAKKQKRLQLYHFPSYAPELNPIEFGWGHLKWHVLANATPKDNDELFETAKSGMCRTRNNRERICSFIEHSKLPFFE